METRYNFPMIKRENFISEATDEENSDDDDDNILGNNVASVYTTVAANVEEIIIPDLELKPDIKVEGDIKIKREIETESVSNPMSESKELPQSSVSVAADRECLFCDRVFLYPNQLLNHMRIHTNEKPFDCRFCRREHSYKKALLKHIRFHHSQGEKSVKGSECSICGKMIADLTEHFRRVHSQIKRAACPDCGKTFFKTMDLKRHQCRRRTPVPARPRQPGRPVTLQLRQCDICLKTFKRTDYLDLHKKLLHFQNPDVHDEDDQNNLEVQDTKPVFKTDAHVCQICKQVVSTSRGLQRHMKNVHGNDKSEKKFKCTFNPNLCQKSFHQNCDLQRHLRSHTGIKPFKCDTCSKSFSLKGGLTQHKRYCSNTNSN